MGGCGTRNVWEFEMIDGIKTASFSLYACFPGPNYIIFLVSKHVLHKKDPVPVRYPRGSPQSQPPTQPARNRHLCLHDRYCHLWQQCRSMLPQVQEGRVLHLRQQRRQLQALLRRRHRGRRRGQSQRMR